MLAVVFIGFDNKVGTKARVSFVTKSKLFGCRVPTMTGLYLIFPSAFALSMALCISNLTKLDIDRPSTSQSFSRSFLASADKTTEMRSLLLIDWNFIEISSVHGFTHQIAVLPSQYDKCILLPTYAYLCLLRGMI